MEPAEALAALAAFGAMAFILRPLAIAIAKRISGEQRPRGAEIDREEVEELRSELRQVREELSELHERVDFTERLLARQREPGRLPGS